MSLPDETVKELLAHAESEYAKFFPHPAISPHPVRSLTGAYANDAVQFIINRASITPATVKLAKERITQSFQIWKNLNG